MLQFASCLAIGPGIGTSEETKLFLQAVLRELVKSGKQLPVVLDADALNLFAADESLWKLTAESRAAVICTPHMAEFARLAHVTVEQIRENRLQLAGQFAQEKKLYPCPERCNNGCSSTGWQNLYTAGRKRRYGSSRQRRCADRVRSPVLHHGLQTAFWQPAALFTCTGFPGRKLHAKRKCCHASDRSDFSFGESTQTYRSKKGIGN